MYVHGLCVQCVWCIYSVCAWYVCMCMVYVVGVYGVGVWRVHDVRGEGRIRVLVVGGVHGVCVCVVCSMQVWHIPRPMQDKHLPPSLYLVPLRQILTE